MTLYGWLVLFGIKAILFVTVTSQARIVGPSAYNYHTCPVLHHYMLHRIWSSYEVRKAPSQTATTPSENVVTLSPHGFILRTRDPPCFQDHMETCFLKGEHAYRSITISHAQELILSFDPESSYPRSL